MTDVDSSDKSSKRVKPSIDLLITEIPEGTHRVKIVAAIVAIHERSVLLNDGTGQILINLSTYSTDEFRVGQLCRFILAVNVVDGKKSGYLIVFNNITKTQAKQYKRLVKLERRVS